MTRIFLVALEMARNRLLRYTLVLITLLMAGYATAHDARPVFVEITELQALRFQVQWKAPLSLQVQAMPRVLMPESCRPPDQPLLSQVSDAYSLQQSFQCTAGLTGEMLGIRYPGSNPGLSTLIRVQLLDGAQYTRILKPGETNWQIPAEENFGSVARQYSLYGIQHIFAGIDHLLFVACLLFIAGSLRRTIVTITGFTVAHSLTLALSALQLVTVPVPPVEAAIALSIVFLAHEIAVGNKNSWTWRYPLLVSGSFGLLHGFGFAAVLRDIGLPQTELVTGLLFFNLGVEIGQVLFIVSLVFAVSLLGKLLGETRTDLLAHRRSNAVASYAFGVTASFWLIERIAGFVV